MNKKLQKLYGVIVVFILLGSILLCIPNKARAISGYSVMALSNSERSAAGVPSVSYNSSLSQAAQMRAQDMISNDYWSHTSPSGLSMGYFLGAVGYPVYAAGENLYRGYDSDGDVVAAWMGSSSHRTTVLNADYNEIGVGYASGSLGGESTTVVVAYYASTGPVYAPAPVVYEPPAPAPAEPSRAPIGQSAPINNEASTAPVQPESTAQSNDITVTATVPIPTTQPVSAMGTFAGSAIEQSTDTGTEQPTRSFWTTVTNLLQYFELFYIIKHASLVL